MGSLALLGSMPRLFSLKAVEPVECLLMTREKFTKAIAQFPELMPRLLNSVVARIRNWEKGAIRAIVAQEGSLQGMAGISAI
jgi:CRP-like cAMP-binding protein